MDPDDRGPGRHLKPSRVLKERTSQPTGPRARPCASAAAQVQPGPGVNNDDINTQAPSPRSSPSPLPLRPGRLALTGPTTPTSAPAASFPFRETGMSPGAEHVSNAAHRCNAASSGAAALRPSRGQAPSSQTGRPPNTALASMAERRAPPPSSNRGPRPRLSGGSTSQSSPGSASPPSPTSNLFAHVPRREELDAEIRAARLTLQDCEQQLLLCTRTSESPGYHDRHVIRHAQDLERNAQGLVRQARELLENLKRVRGVFYEAGN